MKYGKCFSRPGWWQTLCGLDAANQGFGWSDKAKEVGCKNCKKRIKRGDHRRWKSRHILMSMRRAIMTPGYPSGSLERK